MFVWNRTVSKQLTDTTPFEQLFQQVPDVSFLITFGSDAYLHIPKKHRTKLDPKSQKLILIGYDQKGRAYKLWNPITKRIYVGVDVIIHETLGFQTEDIMSKSIESYLENITIAVPSCNPTPAASVSTANLPTSSDRPNISMPSLSDDSHHIQNENVPNPVHPEHDAYSYTTSVPHQPPPHIQGNIDAQVQGENDAPIPGEIIAPVQEEFAAILPEESQFQSDSSISFSAGSPYDRSVSDEQAHADNTSEEEDLGF